MKLVYDIETDGIEGCKVIHSLCAIDVDTEEEYSFADQPGYPSIDEGLKLLDQAELLIGHNLISFDDYWLHKLKNKTYLHKTFDTLNACRLIWTDIKSKDARNKELRELGLVGRHGLEAWGYRLGCKKGTFGKTTDWNKWSPEMQEYCMQDVRVNLKLYQLIMSKGYSEESLQLEMDFQKIISEQQRNGIWFDYPKALEMYKKLDADMQEVLNWAEEKLPIVKIASRSKKVTYFNPGSRQQILDYLKQKYKWNPVDKTETGNPSLKMDVLEKLPFKEAPYFFKYLQAGKIKSRLKNKEGKGLLAAYRDGKVFGRMITNGAVTGRCTHQLISNIPRVTSYMGKEFRSLFTSGPYLMVGCDASGLELRVLAHYLHPLDNGEYANEILRGDVHTKNQKAAELATRDNAKTFIYALLYGAGDEKLGSIATTGSDAKEVGSRLRRRFFTKIPAIERLLRSIKNKAQAKGFLIGLDGREINVRSPHSAPNALFQSAGAIVMKRANVILWQDLEAEGLAPYCKQLLNYHDEYQLAVTKPELADKVGEIMAQAITKAGEYYNFRCPLEGEYKIGKNWAETH